jgi:hypothetical protein
MEGAFHQQTPFSIRMTASQQEGADVTAESTIIVCAGIRARPGVQIVSGQRGGWK